MRGADVNAADANGQTPFLLAVKKGTHGTRRPVSGEGRRRAGRSMPGRERPLLHEAALRGYSGVVETLLARGVPKNAKDTERPNGALLCAEIREQDGGRSFSGRTASRTSPGRRTSMTRRSSDQAAQGGRGLRSGTSGTPAGRSRPSPRSSSSIIGTTTPAPDEKLLANGHIRPEELAGLPVYRFRDP